eukprot:2360762-Amphidinium_carterae.1
MSSHSLAASHAKYHYQGHFSRSRNISMVASPDFALYQRIALKGAQAPSQEQAKWKEKEQGHFLLVSHIPAATDIL